MNSDIRNIIKVASVYTGTILGAGFASGQEIKQFFVVYGYKSIYGILLSGALFSLFGMVVLNKIYSKKIKSYEQYVVPLTGKFLERVLEMIICLFMLSSFCVMVAGNGAMFREEFGMAEGIGIFLMAGLCLLIFLYDIKGVIAVNEVLTPVMLIGITLLGSYIIIFRDHSVVNITPFVYNIMNNWISSSLIYVSYNTLTLIVILTALEPLLTKRRIALLGGLLGGCVLGVIAFILWAVLMIFYSDIILYEIPFLQIVMKKGRVMEIAYVFILFCAMFTTAVSNGYGFLNRMVRWTGINKKVCAVMFCLSSIPLAYLGFSNLVRGLYSFFGYLGIFMVVITLLDGMKEFFV
ncbi:MAG: hypothetical protein GX066_01860 [Clostridiaceae bacterium]|nr:hypothetical protein [Clostridiaceae bacterium]